MKTLTHFYEWNLIVLKTTASSCYGISEQVSKNGLTVVKTKYQSEQPNKPISHTKNNNNKIKNPTIKKKRVQTPDNMRQSSNKIPSSRVT